MRSLDERFVKRSVVSREGVHPSDAERVQLVLEQDDKQQAIRIDLGDRVYTKDYRSFWAPLYFIDEYNQTDDEGIKLIAVLAFNTQIDVEEVIRGLATLPYKAIASPEKDKLTPKTWETFKDDIRLERIKTVGALSLISAGVVGSIFYAYKKIRDVRK